MTGDSIVLWGNREWTSPYFFSVYATLQHKKLPFSVQTLDLMRGEQREPEFARKSRTARIPTLEHGSFSVAESSAIVEYLEDVFPEPAVLPTAPQAKAHARALMSWIRSDVTLPIREQRGTDCMFGLAQKKPLNDAGEAALQRLVEVGLASYQDYSSEHFCVAAADLAFMLQRLIRVGEGTILPPALVAFAEDMFRTEPVQAFLDARSRQGNGSAAR